MVQHLNIKIYGRVQGVLFRYYAREKAQELGIAGFVQNTDDGGVYIEAEGEQKLMDQFLAWCKKGPALSRVEKVEVISTPLKNFSDFQTL